jgi:RND superfamily putative drug exporter
VIARLGRFCFRRRRLVLVLWIVALFGVNAVSQVVGTSFDTTFSIPASESRDGLSIIDEHFGDVASGFGGTIVFTSEAGVDDPEVQAAMEAMFTEADEIDEIVVTSPYSEFGARQISEDGTVAYAQVALVGEVDQLRGAEIGGELQGMIPEVDGLEVEIGGQIFAEFEPPESELIGLSFAVIVLIVSFGSVLAMGLPIGMALFGVGTGFGLIALMSNLFAMPDFATTLGAMIGLGVGIDYALFVVTRVREGLHGGMRRSGDWIMICQNSNCWVSGTISVSCDGLSSILIS